MRQMRRTVLTVAATFVVLAVMVAGSWLAAYEASRSSTQSTTNGQRLQSHSEELSKIAAAENGIKASENGVQRLLAFVASLSTSPQATKTRDVTTWLIAEMEAVCAGEPGCHPVPLPASLSSR